MVAPKMGAQRERLTTILKENDKGPNRTGWALIHHERL